MEIRAMGAELFNVDRRKDITKLIIVFRNFAKAPKNENKTRKDPWTRKKTDKTNKKERKNKTERQKKTDDYNDIETKITPK